ncbi:MarR family transcriptional regulator [Mycolicibacterium setense]|uniref:MarR family winged helix-turn-helix transcriptional regulator n=1 Tax=Mycolicibacterium setense TaxID=431269 RepID=UPI0007EB1D1A|nr:MarR family transcriptional regulator [Mycolicibacterium setense]OBB15924.1 MarR family transcriptional regulator [Mycolicibacterium setense]
MADEPIGVSALDQRIPFLLSQLGAHVAEEFKARLEPLGLHPRATAVLLALAAADGQSQRELYERLGLHRNVMVTLIDTLEAEELVERRPHPDDRRAFAVSLTGRARELIPALDDAGRALEGELTAPLSDDERVALRDTLRRLSAAAGLIPGVHPGLA